MNVKCLTRKRIWEVDCWSLDAAMAGSFDWRELVNMLQGHGHSFDLRKPESLLEIQVQYLTHEYCHSENPISTKIESLLNDWHKKTIEYLDRSTLAEIAEHVLTFSWTKKSSYAGLFWALGSDARDGFDCIRRRFHQRFQIVSVRRLND
ncbi:MAG: hypothetical protein HYZ84_00825 [Candidatus Omnitrophica bacterium]|nr:hypothetical protein [Candidatus Omnitrophota bacterium]